MSTLKVNNVQDLGADAVVTNGVVNASALPAGSILQVVSTTKTDTFTTAATTFTDVTGLSASITPSATSSKILVQVFLNSSRTIGASSLQAQLVRDSTAIGIGDAAGSRQRATFAVHNSEAGANEQSTAIFLDSPSTTSALTYKLQVRNNAGGAGVFINRTETDTDNDNFVRSISSITLMEVAG